MDAGLSLGTLRVNNHILCFLQFSTLCNRLVIYADKINSGKLSVKEIPRTVDFLKK